jgi:hypothetical protein
MTRATIWFGGLVGWLALTGSLTAQTEGRDATIRVPWAEVRGNRSELFPVTGMLRQGQPVRVIREEDGYLAITPPPGSSSWIQDRVLKHTGSPTPGKTTSAYVLIDDAEVRLGGEKVALPLAVETARLKRGTIVRVLGDKAFAEGKEWWRIQPPPSEVRYIAKDAVNLQTSTVVASSPASGGAPAPAMLTNQSSNPLWSQAEQAEQVRDYARAEMLYRQLAGQEAQPGGNHDLAIRCYNRIEQLSRRPAATWPARQPAPGMLVSAAPPAVSAAPAPTTATPNSGGVIGSGPGWLRRTSVTIDGKTAFVLEDNRAQPRYYVLAQPGVNLEYYVNRPVEVFGALVQRSDLTGGGYLSVSRLQLLR